MENINDTLLELNNVNTTSKKKILIIEDSFYMRRVLRDIMLSGGYDVTDEAEDGETGLELIKNTKYDLVTLDITLPGISGLDVLKELKETNPGLPVVIISAIMQSSVYMEVLKLGAKDFIMKPFNEENILRQLQNIFKTGK